MTTTTSQTDSYVRDRYPQRDQLPTFCYDLPELQIADQANVVRDLFAAASQRGDGNRPLFRTPTRTLTYDQAQAKVNRISALLTDRYQLQPGNRVLLRGGNSIGMALAWLACVNAGMIAVATMPLLRSKELRQTMDKAKPSLAICDRSLLEEMILAVGKNSGSTPILAFSEALSADDMETLAQPYDANYPACATAADDVAILAFTSGTTGAPKAVITTHRDILAACNAWPRHILKATADDIVAGSPPLAFTFGTGGLLIYPMWAGASVYFTNKRYRPESMVQEMRQHGITISYTSPTFYRQMAPYIESIGVPSLRICVSAGEALPDATRQLWKKASGIELLDGIGGTEMWHIYISSAGKDIRPGSIGKVVPGYQAKVVDENNNEVPHGSVGRLAVIGPTGCRYMDDERQSRYVQNGWNHPGDSFIEDEDGYFFYQARDDDMIVTSGYNVSAPEVENCLLGHPAVNECGIVAKPDADRGNIILAFVVLEPGHQQDNAMVKALQDYVKSSIAPYKYPRSIVFKTELPHTKSGKLQRFKLRELANADV